MIIIKIGGGESVNIQGIIENLKELKSKFVIVHGANALRDNLGTRLGIERKIITSISGYQSVFSDKATMDLQFMSYSGLKNKRIVELCQQNGINAIGLSGIDGKLIQAKRNKGIKVFENNKKKIVRDFSGKPVKINKELLELLLDNGYVPVITIPILDEQNIAVNSENDDIVVLLQQTLNADTVIHFIESKGLLKTENNAESYFNRLNLKQLKDFEQTVQGRIKRKILSLIKLLNNNTKKIIIADGRTKNPVNKALNNIGTVITKEAK
jgi:acetylglutamate/LysW-gamma-L-alpha-aminoadipate kinase